MGTGRCGPLGRGLSWQLPFSLPTWRVHVVDSGPVRDLGALGPGRTHSRALLGPQPAQGNNILDPDFKGRKREVQLWEIQRCVTQIALETRCPTAECAQQVTSSASAAELPAQVLPLPGQLQEGLIQEGLKFHSGPIQDPLKGNSPSRAPPGEAEALSGS